MASLWKRKKDGRWCVSYWENGKQYVRSLRTTSRREALQLKRAIEVALVEGRSVVVNVEEAPEAAEKNPTFEEFWEQFKSWATIHRSASAIEEYGVWFRRIKESGGFRRLGDIAPRHVEALKASLARQGKKKAKGIGLKAASINNGLKTLQSIWNHAIKLDLYSGKNPFMGVERLRVPGAMNRDFLDKDTVDKLLKCAKERSDDKFVKDNEARNTYLAIALMALAGLRKREASFARWEWVDWDQRVLIVANAEDGSFTTKNLKPRSISMSAQLMEILAPHRTPEGYILESVRATNGKSHYRVDFKHAFQAVCKKAGVRATPHDLRHSFATRHAVAGTSLHVIAGWLGHSTTWITQRYAHFQKTFNAAADNI
jgi:integrase